MTSYETPKTPEKLTEKYVKKECPKAPKKRIRRNALGHNFYQDFDRPLHVRRRLTF